MRATNRYLRNVGVSVAALVIAAIAYLTVVNDPSVHEGEVHTQNGSSEPDDAIFVQEDEVASQADDDFVGRAKMSEASLRSLALRLPTPEYPPASIAGGSSGLAVASVLIDTDGSVADVTVLETPDIHIGQAMETALREARFPPINAPEGDPLRVEGTMTYDFRLGDSGPEVIVPGAMGSTPGIEPEANDPDRRPQLVAPGN